MEDVAFRPNRLLVFLNSAGAHGASIPADAQPENLERYIYQFRVGPTLDSIAKLKAMLPEERQPLWAGKTLRQTFDTATGKAAIHRVSAWASAQAIENGLHCVLDVTMNQGPRASRRPTAELDGIQQLGAAAISKPISR